MDLDEPKPDMLCELQTRYGAFVVPYENDLIADTLKTYGEWAENEVSLLRTMIRPGDTVLDIGACYGTHTRAFSQAVGETGKVISFEACEQTGEFLRKNIELAPIANIEMHRVALDSISGRTISMAGAHANRGAMHIVTMGQDATQGGHAVTSTLDEFCLPRVDLLKIDVEGHEIQVLAGGNQTLKRCRPIVFCEMNSISAGFALYQCWSLEHYAVMGIRSFAVNKNNFLKNPMNVFGDASECGVLFVPEERGADVPAAVTGNVITKITQTEDIVAMALGQVQYISKFWAMNEEGHALSELRKKNEDLQYKLESKKLRFFK